MDGVALKAVCAGSQNGGMVGAMKIKFFFARYLRDGGRAAGGSRHAT